MCIWNTVLWKWNKVLGYHEHLQNRNMLIPMETLAKNIFNFNWSLEINWWIVNSHLIFKVIQKSIWPSCLKERERKIFLVWSSLQILVFLINIWISKKQREENTQAWHRLIFAGRNITQVTFIDLTRNNCYVKMYLTKFFFYDLCIWFEILFHNS